MWEGLAAGHFYNIPGRQAGDSFWWAGKMGFRFFIPDTAGIPLPPPKETAF